MGFFAVLPMASPASSLSRSALRARDVLVLEHLPLADAVASAAARRLFPLVEREDLIQVARKALVRSAPRCRAGEPAGPYLRRCIAGALKHHLRDRVRLVRISRREHDKGPARSATPASMLPSPVSTPCWISWPPPSPSGLAAVLLMGWRWSAWWSSCPAPRPRPCGSPSSRASPCEPPRRSCRSARWRCSGPKRRPSPPCPSSWWGRAEAPPQPRGSCHARGNSQRTRRPLAS